MNYTKIRPCVWHIEESYRVYCTLVLGERCSILFDTGQGRQDLRGFLEETAGTDYYVLCSHGHADHAGGICAFPQVYLHPDDHGLPAPASYARQLCPLLPGTCFDLGGLHAQVVSLKGHTRGSVGLLLYEEHLLLAGDALSPRLQLLGPGAGTPADLQETLQAALLLPFDTFLTGHAPGETSKSQISAHLTHLAAFRWEDAQPAHFGARPCLRSTWKGPEGRSVFLFDESLRNL